MRRDCKVPRCTVCRRFGHEATQCVRTYAHVTGPVGDADAAENRMDEEEAGAAAAGGGGASAPGDPLAEPDVEDVNAAPVEQQSTSQNNPAPVAPVLDAKSEECAEAGSTNTALTREVRDAGNDDGDDPGATVKRPRKEDDKREDSGDSGNVKASVGGVMLRRPSFKPKPNTTSYDRGPAAGKPPKRDASCWNITAPKWYRKTALYAGMLFTLDGYCQKILRSDVAYAVETARLNKVCQVKCCGAGPCTVFSHLDYMTCGAEKAVDIANYVAVFLI
ncbi:uncharacterized protein LOC144163897 [Haemaphysalis longicornis]